MNITCMVVAKQTGFDAANTELDRVWNALPFIGEMSARPHDGMWIAGGAVRRTIAGERLTADIDVFFRDAHKFDLFTKLIVKDPSTVIMAERQHLIQYRFTVKREHYVIQAIRRGYFAGIPELLSDFDFTICQFAFDGVHVYCGLASEFDLRAKQLHVVNPHTPVSTLRRIGKYRQQGFRMADDEARRFLKMVVAAPASIDAPTIESDPIEDEARRLEKHEFFA